MILKTIAFASPSLDQDRVHAASEKNWCLYFAISCLLRHYGEDRPLTDIKDDIEKTNRDTNGEAYLDQYGETFSDKHVISLDNISKIFKETSFFPNEIEQGYSSAFILQYVANNEHGPIDQGHAMYIEVNYTYSYVDDIALESRKKIKTKSLPDQFEESIKLNHLNDAVTSVDITRIDYPELVLIQNNSLARAT
jgi:hypothetical protein